MAHELPDNPEELKQYVEYLLDQNQFLDEELTKAEKEKLELHQNQLTVQNGDLTDYSQVEDPMIAIGKDFDRIREDLSSAKELGSDKEALLVFTRILIQAEHVTEYLRRNHPELLDAEFGEMLREVKSAARGKMVSYGQAI